MVKLYDGGAFLVNGTELVPEQEAEKLVALTGKNVTKEEAKKGTIAYSILKEHNTADNMEHLKLRFDSMASHDITFVGIIQTARASGLTEFPIPYVMTNCHNSLCAVGVPSMKTTTFSDCQPRRNTAESSYRLTLQSFTSICVK